MRMLDVFGMRLLADKHGGRWRIFYPGADGKRRLATDLVVPDSVVTDDELTQYLADLCHERATPKNSEVRWIV